LDDLRAHQDEVDIARSHEIEAEIGHDKMIETRAYAEQCPIGGGKTCRWRRDAGKAVGVTGSCF